MGSLLCGVGYCLGNCSTSNCCKCDCCDEREITSHEIRTNIIKLDLYRIGFTKKQVDKEIKCINNCREQINIDSKTELKLYEKGNKKRDVDNRMTELENVNKLNKLRAHIFDSDFTNLSPSYYELVKTANGVY